MFISCARIGDIYIIYISRYDLFTRVQRLEDTMFSKADAKEMETRLEAKKKRMDVQFFITTSIS
jgi:hypothetical protein